MNKRTLLLLFVSFVCFTGIFGQPREDGEVTAKIVKSSQVVSSIVGWEYDMAQKKWAGYYNALNNQYRRNNNKVPLKLTPSDMSNCNNVISLQFKKVLFEGEAYYLLYYATYEGAWRYPSIYRDWYYGKVTILYVFTPEEYEKLKNLQEGINAIKTIRTTNYGHESFSMYSNFNSAFNDLFESKEKLFKEKPMTWYVKKEDERTIRFQSISYAELKSGKILEITDSPNFDMRYFEISYNNFSKIFIQE